MSLSLIPSTDFRTMAWKNGGGTTIEMLTSPDGAGLANFDWRISMARVETNGPFSSFEGIDRTICILDGAGLVLKPHQRGSVILDTRSAPFAFPGDLPLDAFLIDGPITDLNIMARRGRFRAFVSRLSGPDVIDVTTVAATTLLLTGYALEARCGNQHVTAEAKDLIRLDGTGLTCSLSAVSDDQHISLHLIELWPIA